ncbi:hypothetical protein [Jeotgalibacillus proteolyticus]
MSREAAHRNKIPTKYAAAAVSSYINESLIQFWFVLFLPNEKTR